MDKWDRLRQIIEEKQKEAERAKNAATSHDTAYIAVGKSTLATSLLAVMQILETEGADR